MRVLRRGETGEDVAEVRAMLEALGLIAPANGSAPHGTFDAAVEHGVRAFQQDRGLLIDGVVGPATYRTLRGASYRLGSRPLAFLVSAPVHGDDVLTLQERLTELGYDSGRPDGVFGAQTEQGLRTFQRDYGLLVDGICGAAVVRALRQLSPRARGGRPVFLREQEQVRQAGPRLRGKRIVIDPGHGGVEDPGIDIRGVREADVTWDLARRLEGRMKATGMEALVSRGESASPAESERAAFANDAGADLFLSLHSDRNSSPYARGVASFHFGNGGTTSTVGELLAGFIQRELAARTGMVDCRAHPKTWEILRLTRCPAVRVEVGYLTNPGDRARLSDPGFRDVVAEGLLIAVKRLYLLGENDQPTGTFTFADVLAHEVAR